MTIVTKMLFIFCTTYKRTDDRSNVSLHPMRGVYAPDPLPEGGGDRCEVERELAMRYATALIAAALGLGVSPVLLRTIQPTPRRCPGRRPPHRSTPNYPKDGVIGRQLVDS